MNKVSRRGDAPHARIYAKWLQLPAYTTLHSHSVRLLVHLLASYRPSKPNLFALSNTRIAEICGCSRNSAAQYIDALVERRWVQIEQRGKASGPSGARSRHVSLMAYHTDTRAARPDLFEAWAPDDDG